MLILFYYNTHTCSSPPPAAPLPNHPPSHHHPPASVGMQYWTVLGTVLMQCWDSAGGTVLWAVLGQVLGQSAGASTGAILEAGTVLGGQYCGAVLGQVLGAGTGAVLDNKYEFRTDIYRNRKISVRNSWGRGGLGPPPGSCLLVVAIWPLGHLLVSAYIAQWSSFRLNRQAS